MRIAPAQRPHEPCRTKGQGFSPGLAEAKASVLRTVSIAALAIVLMPHASGAQSLGTFRWQLQPYCNLVTVAVTQNGGVYELTGTDDQCGAAQAASASGTAFFNPDGSIGFGLAIVNAPSGSPVHVDATISLSTLSGTWRDSAGGSGAFAFTPGAGIGGSPRPAPTSSLTPGSVGSVQVDPSQVQLRVNGSCASGQFMRSVAQSGTVSCAADDGDVSSVAAGMGLVGGGSSGAVAIGLPTTQNGAFLFSNSHGFAAIGTTGGSIPIAGAGRRAMWYPAKAAFRAGNVTGTQWNEASIGSQSVAFGANTTASGTESVAIGFQTTASGQSAAALGENTVASGAHAFAMGDATVASGGNSVALGARSSATAFESVAMGLRVTAGANGSVVLGSDAVTVAGATGTFIFADRSTTNDFGGFAPNEFLVRAAGGAGFYTNAALTAGVSVAPGGGSWSSISDVNMKENFRDLSPDDVLTKLAGMPIREWNYKSQDATIRHAGPTAQDFHAAFGLGESELRISTIDADGIALAGVQALEIRTRDLQARADALARENDALKGALAALQDRLDRLEAKR